MARNAQPVDILVAKGKKHLTKKEIDSRKQSEVKLGKKDLEKLEPPTFVKNDVTAFKYWRKHLKEYKDAAKQGIEVLTSSDIGMLAMYCRTYSEYESLLKRKAIMELNLQNSPLGFDDFMKIESAVNKKMDMLIKMQDRLFLNPLAKVKNVPQKPKDKPQNPMEEEYDI